MIIAMRAFIAAADLNVGEAIQKGFEVLFSCWLALGGECIQRNWNADL